MQVSRAARHLYQRCLENSKAAHNSQAGLGSQLKIIGNFVSDYMGAIQAHQTRLTAV